MIAVLQRVSSGGVTVGNHVVGKIGHGLVVLLGVMGDDETDDIEILVNKISGLRIFADENDKMNLSIKDVDGNALVVSQFTLCADTRKGRRPSFVRAASPEKGNAFYEKFIEGLRKEGIDVESGEFGAMMDVTIHNNGPVTIVLDSRD